ncbi:unnamed protein product [Blepharisma stoltei]|uniref:Uncharacterized protein n=1 Tax=Blepharisma stoltei TaxID=1481888 RepID=A0AAU9JBM2_9CILI|nr:unnamed protein product [Blepharisma stoltei]
MICFGKRYQACQSKIENSRFWKLCIDEPFIISTNYRLWNLDRWKWKAKGTSCQNLFNKEYIKRQLSL